jgi:hypothetical protein
MVILVSRPLIAPVMLAALLLTRRRRRERAEREAVARQVAETVAGARSQISLSITEAMVESHAALRLGLEEALRRRRATLMAEGHVLAARARQSAEQERARQQQARERIAAVDDTNRSLERLLAAAGSALRDTPVPLSQN